jgi:hypothetical protein
LSVLISLSLVGTLGTLGCSGEDISTIGNSTDPAEDALISSHLEALGYDTSSLQFSGNTVIVEDDMVMSRAVLLGEAEAEASGVVEKGYFIADQNHTSLPGPLFAGKRIQLSFAANVTTAWRTALNAAKNEWNSKTPMFARDPGGAGTINVSVQALVNSVTHRPDTGTIATGTIPAQGHTITLNSNYSNTSCGQTIDNMTANQKAYQALHEMGHVLGYAHPPPNPTLNARLHIDGTATNTGLLEPSYETVMAQGCGTRTTLTPDDILSAQKKYPSCIAKCENDCTFNVDPSQIGLCQSACPAQCGG